MKSNSEKLPRWMACSLSSADLVRIEQALAEAESKTSGEIVPVVVHRSSPTNYISPLLIFILVCFAMYLHYSFGVSPIAYVVAVAVALGLSKVQSIQCYFSNLFNDHDFPLIRAKLAFYERGVNQTKARTGILLFISLMEHRVIILADKAINDKLAAETWQNLVDELIQAAKQKRLGEGFVTVIKQCGEILALHLPRQVDDANEIPDKLTYYE